MIECFARQRRGPARRAPAALLLAVMLTFTGCAHPPPDPGTTEASVLKEWGTPTSRYAMPQGAARLEYATGPYGRTTWMIDVDAAGRVTQARQVLNEASFADFQARGPGMSRDELLRALGRPGETRKVGWQGEVVWAWRYPTNDCLWFQVSLDKAEVVLSGSYGIAPGCDAPSDKGQ